MNVTCTVKGADTKTTDISVGGKQGWVRITTFLPNESVISLTPSQAMQLGKAIIETAWDQR